MMLKLNVGVGPHYAAGWVNIDVVARPDAGINPDVVASIIDLPYADGTVDWLYAGHCLEHLSLQDAYRGVDGDNPSTFDAAMIEIRRVLKGDGVAAFVCPDVYRALEWWKSGRAGWELVDACLEGPDSGIGVPIDGDQGWEGLYHAWNCNEARLHDLVRRWFPDAVAVPMDSPLLKTFPVVSNVGWQCAVLTRTPL